MTENKVSKQAYLFVCMGVSACGKTSLAKAISQHFKFEFLEGDDYHCKENIEYMSSGKPLTDDMREPWMNAICHDLSQRALERKNCVIANSALRLRFRNMFRSLDFQTHFLYLDVSKKLAKKRIQSRSDHFMPEKLLESQFDSLEPMDKENDIIPLNADAAEDIVKAHAFQYIHAILPTQ